MTVLVIGRTVAAVGIGATFVAAASSTFHGFGAATGVSAGTFPGWKSVVL
ncbi:MAG: hypothetical protein M3457_20210 [Chloroflexota bacterium]|nr:hypothetical protein [Chloroflexota bacterium]